MQTPKPPRRVLRVTSADFRKGGTAIVHVIDTKRDVGDPARTRCIVTTRDRAREALRLGTALLITEDE